jgi:hypothetical protein
VALRLNTNLKAHSLLAIAYDAELRRAEPRTLIHVRGGKDSRAVPPGTDSSRVRVSDKFGLVGNRIRKLISTGAGSFSYLLRGVRSRSRLKVAFSVDSVNPTNVIDLKAFSTDGNPVCGPRGRCRASTTGGSLKQESYVCPPRRNGTPMPFTRSGNSYH